MQRDAYALPETCGPAGTTLTMSAEGLLRFVRMLMRNGVSLDGNRLLPEVLVREMLAPQRDLPRFALGFTSHVGLAALHYKWESDRLWGHDGDTLGFQAFLRVHPASDTALALLTNGGRSWDLANAVFAAVLPELAGVHFPSFPAADASVPVSNNRYAGRYRREGRCTLVEPASTGLAMRIADNDEALATTPRLDLRPVEPDVFRFQFPNQQMPGYTVFSDFDADGRARTIFSGYRLSTRAA